MAKKRKTTRVVLETPEPEEEPVPETARVAEPVDEDVEDLLGQLPHESKAELWKWGEVSQDWDYVARFPVQGFTLDMVRDRYGPGKYRLIVRGPREDPDTGRTRIVQLARRHFSIAGAGASPGSAAGMSLSDLLKFQMQMMQTMAMAPKENIAELVRSIHELVTPRSDPIQTAVQLLQLVQGKEKGSVGEMLELLQMGMDLGEKIGAKEDSIGVFAKAFADLVSNLPKSGRQPAQIAAPETSSGDAAASAHRELAEWIQALDTVMAGPSRLGGDIEEWAEWVLYQIDTYRPELSSVLDTWFAAEDYPMQVMKLFPKSDPTWLRAVLLKCREIATTADTEGDQAES